MICDVGAHEVCPQKSGQISFAPTTNLLCGDEFCVGKTEKNRPSKHWGGLIFQG